MELQVATSPCLDPPKFPIDLSLFTAPLGNLSFPWIDPAMAEPQRRFSRGRTARAAVGADRWTTASGGRMSGGNGHAYTAVLVRPSFPERTATMCGSRTVSRECSDIGK